MYDGSLKFDTQINTEGFQKGTDKLSDFVKGLGVYKIVEKGVQAIIGSIDSAVARVDTLNKFPRVMEQMGYGADNAKESINRLSDGIQGLPTTLDSIVGATQRLVIATGSLDKGTDTALALNNALLASGASSEAASRGTEQYIQALSRGKIDAMEWKTLMETMPYAMDQIAQAFGFTGPGAVQQLQAALSSGQITMNDFNDKLIALNGGVNGFAAVAQTASGGIATSWANVQTAVVRGTANVIQAIDSGLAKFGGIAGVMDGVKGAVNTAFTAISGGANLLMQNLDTLAAAAIGVGVAFASYKAIQAWEAAAKGAATVSKFLADTNQQLTLAVGKTAAAQLEQVAAAKLQEAQDTRARFQKLELIATEKLNAAESLKAAAAQATGAEATRLSSEAAKAATVAEQAQTAAKAASTIANQADTAAVHADIAAQNARNTSMGLGTALIGFLTGSITLHQLATAAATVATTLFGMAMNALPLFAIIAGIALLVTGIVKLIQWLAAGSKEYQKQKEEVEALAKAQEELAASTKESADAYESSADQIAAQGKVQRDLVKSLRDVQNSTVSADEKNRKMADTVAQLNSSVEGLNIAYDEETGAIRNINTGQEISLDQLEQLVDAKAELAQANAWTERYNDLIKEQITIQENLAVIEAKKQEIMANSNLSAKEQEKLIKELDEAAAGHATTMEDVEMRLAIVNDNLASTNTAAAESIVSDYERMEQAITKNGESIEDVATRWNVSVDTIMAAWDAAGGSFEEFVASQDAALEDYAASVQERTQGVVNSFKEIPAEYDKSATEMLEILIANKTRYAEWETAMEEITRQLGPTAAEEFAKLGPEATSAMQEILGSAELLDQYRETFGVKIDEATGLAVENWNDPNFIGAPSGAIDSSAQMVTGNTSLDTAMTGTMENARAAAEAVDFTTVGQDISAQIVNGLNSADVTGAMGQITTAIQSSTSGVTGAITSMSTSVQTVLRTMSTQAVSIVTQMMTNINSAVVTRTGTVKASTQAMTNGIVTVLNELPPKGEAAAALMMTNINSAIITRTGTVTASTTALTNGVVNALAPMESGAVAATNRMMDGMLSAMNRKASELYAKAREIANQIAATLAAAWDEHSPSRVSYKIMAFFMQAMYNAMDDMSGLLFREADSIADGLTDRLTLSPDVFGGLADTLRAVTEANPLGGSTLTPQLAYAGAEGGVRYTTSLTQNITSPKPLSPSEMTQEGQDLLRRSQWQLP